MWAGGRSHEHGEQKHSGLKLTVKVTTFPLLLLWELISQTAVHISTQTTPSCSRHHWSPTEFSLCPCPISAAAAVDSCACWQCPTWILHASYSMLSLKPRELALEVGGEIHFLRGDHYTIRDRSHEKYAPQARILCWGHSEVDSASFSRGLSQDWVLVTQGNNQV